MIRGFFRILTLLLVGAFGFALGVYTGPTEPVVQLRASLEEKIASALQSLRVQTDKAKLPAKEATRPPQPAPAASSAPESSAAAPAPTEARNRRYRSAGSGPRGGRESEDGGGRRKPKQCAVRSPSRRAPRRRSYCRTACSCGGTGARHASASRPQGETETETETKLPD